MELAKAFGFLAGSFVVGLVSGLVPVVNTEAYLLAVAAFAPSDRLLPVIVLTTVGQMIAKSLLYLAGSGVMGSRFLGARAARLDEVKSRLERAPTGVAALVFASATAGWPPFYLVSLAAGSLRYSLARFVLVGGSGRLVRFTALVSVSRLLGVMP